MTPTSPSRAAGRALILTVFGLSLALGITAHLWAFIGVQRLVIPDEVRIGTASKGGTYYTLGEGLADVLREELAVDDTVVRAIPTDGTIDNIEKLSLEELDFAFVQSDAPDHDDVRMVAKLYDEVMHIVVNLDNFDEPPRTIRDLKGHELGIGPLKSGTRVAASGLLNSYRVRYSDSYVQQELPDTRTAYQAFKKGKIDAMFILAGPPSEGVEDLLKMQNTALLQVDDPDDPGYRLTSYTQRSPVYSPKTLHPGDYGEHPATEIPTISVTALLVAHKDLPSPLVRKFTEVLFKRKADLARDVHNSAQQIGETTALHIQPFPDHDGAELFHTLGAVPDNGQTDFFMWIAIGAGMYIIALVALLVEWRRWRTLVAERHVVEQMAERMGRHDVFICFSNSSRPSTNAVARIRDTFDQHGISYWYAPTSIDVGAHWAALIPEAIRHTRYAFLLLVSESANSSKQCQREVSLTDDTDLTIIPYCIEDAQLSGSMRYHTVGSQRINEYSIGEEQALSRLCSTLQRLKDAFPAEDDDTPARIESPEEQEDVTRRPWLRVALVAGLAALVIPTFLYIVVYSGPEPSIPELVSPAARALQVGGVPTYQWTYADDEIGVEYEVERWQGNRERQRHRVFDQVWSEPGEGAIQGQVKWRVRALIPGDDLSLKPSEWSEEREYTYYRDSLEKILDTGRVTVAVSADTNLYRDGDGSPTNLEVELIAMALPGLVAARDPTTKFEIVKRDLPWGKRLFTSLQSPEIDLMASNITIRSEREENWRVRFTDPIVTYHQALVHPTDKPVCTGLRAASGPCRLAVRFNTTSHHLATRLSLLYPGTQPESFDRADVYNLLLNTLVDGSADMVLLDEPQAYYLQQRAAGTWTMDVTLVDETVMDAPPLDEIGIGTKVFDERLRRVLNDAIAEHREDIDFLQTDLEFAPLP